MLKSFPSLGQQVFHTPVEGIGGRSYPVRVVSVGLDDEGPFCMVQLDSGRQDKLYLDTLNETESLLDT